MTTDLVPSLNPLDLLQRRDEALRVAQLALSQLMEAEAQFKALDMPGLLPHLFEQLNKNRYAPSCQTLPVRAMEAFNKQLDTTGWSQLLNRSGLRTFMDRTAREQWDMALQTHDTPPLNIENIQATFATIYDERGAMVERGVCEVFRRLSWDYKTNNPFLFGKRIIVRRFKDLYGFLNQDAGGLDDLMRALCLYDGKPEPDHRQGIYFLAVAAQATRQIETDYLQIKWFQNGNAHVVFKRPDLIDKLNQVIGKHYPGALPAPR